MSGGVTGGDVIVVGAGQAAAQLCLSLRAGGFRDRILVIGAERFPALSAPAAVEEIPDRAAGARNPVAAAGDALA